MLSPNTSTSLLFAILQKYDFSSKSQQITGHLTRIICCLRYCKSTIFQANHNHGLNLLEVREVVCDTAKVRFFKQITTVFSLVKKKLRLFAILQKYDFSSKSQRSLCFIVNSIVVCDTAKVRFFKQITTVFVAFMTRYMLFAILQKYDFSSKSQPDRHQGHKGVVVCDTAKVRFFKQITTSCPNEFEQLGLFAILQKYDFSSKSQLVQARERAENGCLRYCKSTIFQANHNSCWRVAHIRALFAILQKYDFSSKSQPIPVWRCKSYSCLRYCKSTIFQANHN